MLQKVLIGYSTETDMYFVRAQYSQMVSIRHAYPIKPRKESEFSFSLE